MMTVSDAVLARVSVRAFLPDPVSETALRKLLEVARFAPSGGNVQPWRIIAVSGAARDRAIAIAKAARAANPEGEQGDKPPYPVDLPEPYRSRRMKSGADMYERLGIARDDQQSWLAHQARNFEFFGAPVGLFFVIDRLMGHSQWAHMGMLMQTIALLAPEIGLSTCMQESWARVRESIAAHLDLPPNEMIYCAMALGRADPHARINQMRSSRVSVDEIAEFKGF